MNAQELEKAQTKLKQLHTRRNEKQADVDKLEANKAKVNEQFEKLKSAGNVPEEFVEKRKKFNQKVATSKITVKTVDKQINAHLEKFPELKKANPKTDEQYHIENLKEMSKPVSTEKQQSLKVEAMNFGLPPLADFSDESDKDDESEITITPEKSITTIDIDLQKLDLSKADTTSPTDYEIWLQNEGSAWLSQGKSLRTITGLLMHKFGHVHKPRNFKSMIIGEAIKQYPKSIGLQTKVVYHKLAK